MYGFRVSFVGQVHSFDFQGSKSVSVMGVLRFRGVCCGF